MTDFSPMPVKAAAKFAKSLAERGEFDGFTCTPDMPGMIEIARSGCTVRLMMDEFDEEVVSLRVIDQNGRHWFPEY
jgi:hypothetical protein